MSIKPPVNTNYCATVVKISQIVKLENCDNVVAAIVSGYQVIVDKNMKIGDIGIFFPVETKLSEKFCKENNQNTDPTLNADTTKKGYVSKGRLKCLRFRGHKSEGLFMGLNSLKSFANESDINSLEVGAEFDHLNGEKICEKYTVMNSNGTAQRGDTKKQSRYKKGEVKLSRLVDNQFQLHCDTIQLKKNMHKIAPQDFISISCKFHGTSAVTARPLITRKLKWYEKLAEKFGVKVQQNEHGLVYSSRNIIKNKYHAQVKEYSEPDDLWYITAKKLEGVIPDGVSLYYEIVGYQPSGKCVQKGYHYGCKSGEHKIVVYRITQVNTSGKFIEYSWNQIKQFCKKYGIEHVPEYYYGYAKDLFPDIKVDETWHDNVLSRLNTSFNMEKMCEYNNNEVPAEGVVVRIDDLDEFKAMKLKAYKFLEKETKDLDSGEVDIESSQQVETNE